MIDENEMERRRNIIVNDYDGILPPFEAFYIQSIMYAADRSKEAFDRYERAVAVSTDAALAVSAVHEALAHAASLSRFFWPPKSTGVAKTRAAKLRRAFSVDGQCPLKDRSLRNLLEHFDERLDEFLLTHDVGCFFPSPALGSHILANDPTGRIFKMVDTEHQIFVALGQKYPFNLIREEVIRISEAAHFMDQNGARLIQV